MVHHSMTRGIIANIFPRSNLLIQEEDLFAYLMDSLLLPASVISLAFGKDTSGDSLVQDFLVPMRAFLTYTLLLGPLVQRDFCDLLLTAHKFILKMLIVAQPSARTLRCDLGTESRYFDFCECQRLYLHRTNTTISQPNAILHCEARSHKLIFVFAVACCYF